MNITPRRAARLRIEAVLVLSARHAISMLYHPHFFPNADALVAVSTRLLGSKGQDTEWWARHVVDPTVRIKMREKLSEMPEYERVARILHLGWWMMTYERLLGLDIRPEHIINSRPTKKEY